MGALDNGIEEHGHQVDFNEEPRKVTVWTNHPSSFPLTSPNLRIDPTTSRHWRDRLYREALPKLHKRLKGETQFLWCLTRPNMFVRVSESIDLVQWELNVSEDMVLTLYREEIWDDLYHQRSEDWGSLFADKLGESVGVLVRLPIDPSLATCHELPVKYSR